MSRSGYGDEYDPAVWLYRRAVANAIAGKRGQRALADLVEALDAMPVKRLVSDSFSTSDGMCSLGALAAHRAVDVSDFDVPNRDPYDEPADRDVLSLRFDIAPSMAAEVMHLNDEHHRPETPEQRWSRMRAWAVANLETDR